MNIKHIILYIFSILYSMRIYSYYKCSFKLEYNKSSIINYLCFSASSSFKLKYFERSLKNIDTKRNGTISFSKRNKNPKFLHQMKELLPDLKYNIRIYIFKKVIIGESGTIHNSHYNMRLDKGCMCNKAINKINNYSSSIEAVYVISQYWSYGTFHSIIECLTKLSYILTDIKSKNVYIHIEKNRAMINYLIFLGISLNRIVTGNIYAKNAYVFENSRCGRAAGIIPLLFLRNELSKRNKYYSELQNILIVIKREKSRSIKNFNSFLKELTCIFQNFTIFIFLPSTSFNDTLYMFGRAKYVIAPHGAGLSNIILCPINVVIIEFLPNSNPNICYTSLAYALGFRYFGIFQNFDGYVFYLNLTYVIKYILKIINITDD